MAIVIHNERLLPVKMKPHSPKTGEQPGNRQPAREASIFKSHVFK